MENGLGADIGRFTTATNRAVAASLFGAERGETISELGGGEIQRGLASLGIPISDELGVSLFHVGLLTALGGVGGAATASRVLAPLAGSALRTLPFVGAAKGAGVGVALETRPRRRRVPLPAKLVKAGGMKRTKTGAFAGLTPRARGILATRKRNVRAKKAERSREKAKLSKRALDVLGRRERGR